MDSQSSEPKPKYKMTIGLSVLEHLGVGLYSNVPAVLSEAVANAWDADAENVRISIDSDRREITIYDDGHGMTFSDINEKYLKVGYKKREREPDFGRTPRFERQPMGRKGIGKLSLFSIADIIEIHSVKDSEKNALRMNTEDIRAKIVSGDNDEYNPEPLASEVVTISQGTQIKLRGLKKRINRADEHLRKRLARRFSIIGDDNFNIEVDDHTISARDRDYYASIEYLWYFGKESERFVELCRNAIRPANCRPATVSDQNGYRISGWIGSAKARKNVNKDTNGIVIFAKGKLAHEDILNDMQEGGIWTKYIIGEIDADFLDDNMKDDMITSSRQRVDEDDPRYESLKMFLKQGVIREIASNWQRLRKDAAAKDVLAKRKNIKRWLDRFEGDQYDYAYDLLGRIETLDVENESEKLPLFKAIMYAFQKLAVTQQLSILQTLETKKDFELILSIFGNLTDLTRALYYEIAKARVDVIREFEQIVDSDSKEKVIQRYISKALWLLDPSWERATTNPRVEQTVKEEFKKEIDKLSEEERLARIDIRFQTIAGKHLIIELKRYSVSVNVHTLSRQISKYKQALEKCLAQKFPEERNPIEIICITGSQSSKSEERQIVVDHLKAYSARYVTYDDLIKSALQKYEEYMKADRHISELVEIIESIDEDFDT
ncbi:MAG: ATP-binding protein [Chloroflexi bacterium]|nr:ATP-binding protein [Chloroflexota bacterium]